MTAITAPAPVQLNKDMKFAARRVPDFAKLHALEDARLARWKREHKKEVTVPLNFRLASAPLPANALPTSHLTKPMTPAFSNGNNAGVSSSRASSKSTAVPPTSARSQAGSFITSVTSENTGFTDSSICCKNTSKSQRLENYKENEIHHNANGESCSRSREHQN
jgi:hypothetical protein